MAENDPPASVDDGRPADSAVAAGSAEAELIPLLTDYLDDLADRAAQRVGRNAGVAVTLSVDGVPFTIGASTTLARDVDLIQYRIGVGPCLYALHHGVGLYVSDLAQDDRWGDYGPAAAARGAASCVSVPVLVAGRPAAVVKIYSSEIDGLTTEQQSVALAVAPEVAGSVGLAKHLSWQAQQLDDRAAAMTTRRSIDVAVGILMQRNGCPAESAFLMLRNVSQTQNRKVRDVANELIAAFPGAGVGPAPFRDRRPPPTAEG